LTALYDQEFWEGGFAYADYAGEKANLQRNFMAHLPLLRRYAPGGRLFEAGCAHGFFLEVASRYWQVEGVDLSAEAIAYARQHYPFPVEVGDFESHPPAAGAYDVVAMWDTIEHLYDPFGAVRASAAALKPGGIIALTTGDISTRVPQWQGQKWRLIHPTHLYYFSKASMYRLMADHGLEVVHFSYPSVRRSLRQMTNVLTQGQKGHTWRHRLHAHLNKIGALGQIYIPVNLYDIMLCIARKPA
jgi:SAM-dependent methyltransferase